MKIEETTQEVASEDDSETKDTEGKEDLQESRGETQLFQNLMKKIVRC